MLQKLKGKFRNLDSFSFTFGVVLSLCMLALIDISGCSIPKASASEINNTTDSSVLQDGIGANIGIKFNGNMISPSTISNYGEDAVISLILEWGWIK